MVQKSRHDLSTCFGSGNDTTISVKCDHEAIFGLVGSQPVHKTHISIVALVAYGASAPQLNLVSPYMRDKRSHIYKEVLEFYFIL